MANVQVSWIGNMNFVGKDGSGHEVTMDASEIYGGLDKGVRPMELLLMAVAGCSGIELTHILNKMRIPFDSLTIAVQGDRVEDHPKVFKTIELKYILKGEKLRPEKVYRALELTDKTYCSVSNMITKAAKVSYVIEINGKCFAYPAANDAALSC